MFARPISWASINGVDLETFVKVNVSRQLQGDFKWRLQQRGVFGRKLVVVERLLLGEGGQRRQNRLITARFALCWLSRCPVAAQLAIISAAQRSLKKVKCAICNGYFSKKTTRQVCFFFYFKKERNQLSRKPNDHGCVSFCKGQMRIKTKKEQGVITDNFFCCSNLLNVK